MTTGQGSIDPARPGGLQRDAIPWVASAAAVLLLLSLLAVAIRPSDRLIALQANARSTAPSGAGDKLASVSAAVGDPPTTTPGAPATTTATTAAPASKPALDLAGFHRLSTLTLAGHTQIGDDKAGNGLQSPADLAAKTGGSVTETEAALRLAGLRNGYKTGYISNDGSHIVVVLLYDFGIAGAVPDFATGFGSSLSGEASFAKAPGLDPACKGYTLNELGKDGSARFADRGFYCTVGQTFATLIVATQVGTTAPDPGPALGQLLTNLRAR